MKPTETDTAAVIKAWLDEKGVAYPSSANKTDLLTLVEQVEDTTTENSAPTEVQQQPVAPEAPTETKFTKSELLSVPSLTGATRDILSIALSDDKKYTYNEALEEANKLKGGLF